jgi:hypothetical protein
MGTRYNTGAWLECRRFAIGFLEEARERLAGRTDALFDAALAHYREVAAHLGRVAEVYPWEWGVSDESVLPVDDRSRAAADALRAARAAEASGLQALEKIVQAL